MRSPSLLEALCGTSLEAKPSLLLNGSAPPLPGECMQHSLLVFVPCIFLWIFTPVILYSLKKNQELTLPWTFTVTTKIAISIILSIDALVLFFYTLYEWKYLKRDLAPIWFIYPLVLYITMATAIVLLLACRSRGVITSGVLFIFWLLLAVCGLPEFRWWTENTFVMNQPITDQVRFVLYMIWYPLILIQLLVSCFADRPGHFHHYHKDKKECPELQTSFLNQLTFHWFTGLAITGNRRDLTLDDLWTLNERDQTHNLVPEFEHHWNASLESYKVRKKQHEQTREFIDAPRSDEIRLLAGNASEPSRSSRVTSANRASSKPPALPSVLWPIFRTYRFTFLGGAVLKFCFDLLQFASPELLSKLIAFIADPSQPMWIGVTIALLMFLIALVQSMILHQYFHYMFRLGMNIRSVLTATVYNKSLRLSNTARKHRTVGEIVNLMSVDIQRFQDMTTFIMLLWSAPLQIGLSIFFLFRLLGVSVLAGIVILLAMIPLNYWVSMKMRNCQVEQMKFKDERIKMMSEILNGIKVLKLYAWEASMEKMVLEIRQKEINVLRKMAYLNAITTLSWSCAPFLVAVLTFGMYVMLDPVNNVLTPQITFVGLALFNILRFPLAIFVMIITQLVQCVVSNKRLKSFLAEDEMDLTLVDRHPVSQAGAVVVEDASFAWDNAGDPVLQAVTMRIPKGALAAIVGRVGTGKSSLLSALLGEINKRSGYVGVEGSVAYVPQQAWIQNQTLRDNVVFGSRFDEAWYDRVLDACALRPDLATLPAGDLTEIGEKGINLSGGQKQRVSLARAVYQQRDTILLDDPLSAVDVHVGKHIFENVISTSGGLLSGRTRILVTHGLTYLKHCDIIFVLKDGTISETGTYQELMTNHGAFAEFLEEFLIEEAQKRGRSVSFGEDENEVNEVLEDLQRFDPVSRHRIEKQMSEVVMGSRKSADSEDEKDADRSTSPLPNGDTAAARRRSSRKRTSSVHPNEDLKPLLDDTAKAKAPATAVATAMERSKLIEKEAMATGKVKWLVYLTYLKAIGYGISLIFFAIYVFSSALGVCSNLWLADWSDKAAKAAQNGSAPTDTAMRLSIYAGLGVGQAVSVCIASVVMALGMVYASRTLHEGILHNILRSPMAFFDVTPTGRITNRLSKDMEIVDVKLPNNIDDYVWCIFDLAATMIVISISSPFGVTTTYPLMAFLHYIMMDVDILDGHLPRSLMVFVRTAIASLEILLMIAWATPIFTVVVGPLVAVYFYALRFYVSTSRQLKRLESTTRSPIYSHFQIINLLIRIGITAGGREETVQGGSTIRAYGALERFQRESEKRVDDNLVTYYPSICANRWLAVRLELVGNMIVLFAALFAALFRGNDGVTAGLVGLSVSYALNITQTLNWAVRMTSELETNIVAVERIKEYSETPTEAAVESAKENAPPKDWPTNGDVEITQLALRYRPGLELVLKGVTAHIKPLEKVGIVGRTGAGKSSLTLALFRLVEADGGRIVIDGCDIAKMGLNDLRSKLTIVPQDPVLFSGSLRMNLDPFNAYDDARVWSALQMAHLQPFVSALPDGLMHRISEGGENLSVGQRQLVCLARALLRKTKILILDEAAAAVDLETDSLIQATIRKEFADCTVLTIAHRLNTVIDSDRLLILENGNVKEFDTPGNLLNNHASLFYSMAKDAGIA